jgi:hypothetical protein
LAVADMPHDKWAELLSSFADDDTISRVDKALQGIKPLPLDQRMALLDLVVAGVQLLSDDEQAALTEAISYILPLAAQPHIRTLAVIWRLTRFTGATPPTGPKATTWEEGAHHVAILLGTLVHCLYGPGVLAPQAYAAAATRLAALGPLPAIPTSAEERSTDIHNALIVLSAASVTTKDAIVDAAGHAVAAEDIPEPRADLVLRLICDAADRDIPTVVDRWV